MVSILSINVGYVYGTVTTAYSEGGAREQTFAHKKQLTITALLCKRCFLRYFLFAQAVCIIYCYRWSCRILREMRQRALHLVATCETPNASWNYSYWLTGKPGRPL